MKQNNKKKTWKAIMAVMLVMATLFSISTVVSAGFVDEIFEEVCEMMSTSTSGGTHTHVPVGTTTYLWQCPHGGYTSKTVATCQTCGASLTITGKTYPCPQGLCSKSR